MGMVLNMLEIMVMASMKMLTGENGLIIGNTQFKHLTINTKYGKIWLI